MAGASSGYSAAYYADLARRRAVQPAPPVTRVVNRVEFVAQPYRAMKVLRGEDILKSRAESVYEPFTPEYGTIINEGESMETVTNADVTNLSSEDKARLAFLTWLKNTQPEIYAAVKREVDLPPQLGGLFDSINWGKIVDTVSKAGTAVLAYKGAKKVLDINLQRAKSGQPPLDPDAYGAAPTIRTQIELDPTVAQAALNKGMQFGLIALAGIAALVLLRKRR